MADKRAHPDYLLLVERLVKQSISEFFVDLKDKQGEGVFQGGYKDTFEMPGGGELPIKFELTFPWLTEDDEEE